MKHKLLIIGGGSSGIFASIFAKDLGENVALLEGSDRIGKKILTTGNGRCNISNAFCQKDRYHSDNLAFIPSILEPFTVVDTVNFFTALGLPLVTLEDGKMYPMSLQASSLLDLFRFALEDRAIPVYLNSKIKDIKVNKNGFILTTDQGDFFECEKLILACGGKSLVKTGSDGSGFSLAKNLGHSIIKPLPALVQLKLNYKHLKALSGIKFNGTAQIFVNHQCLRSEFGEILFTDYGISGPPILQLSRIASLSVSEGKKVTLKITLLDTIDNDNLIDFLEGHWATFGYRSIHDSLIGIIHKKIIPIILKEAGILDIHKPCCDLTWKEKEVLISLFKSWEFEVSGTNSFENAQITRGGIDTREVKEGTLESKLIPNLYFAGEMLDVDGDCGGFNLQWAWSSGAIAAKSACNKQK